VISDVGGRVDPQQLVDDPERAVAGDVEREQTGGRIVRWRPSVTKSDGEDKGSTPGRAAPNAVSPGPSGA
jgi:hypothetical protein